MMQASWGPGFARACCSCKGSRGNPKEATGPFEPRGIGDLVLNWIHSKKRLESLGLGERRTDLAQTVIEKHATSFVELVKLKIALNL